MKALFQSASPYADDAMNLPVKSVEDAIPFYVTTMGFTILARHDEPVKRVELGCDDIRIGLAENGGHPSQEGCFIGVSSVKDAYIEIKGTEPKPDDLRIDKQGDNSYAMFFVIAPDGLCYCIGEKQ